MAPPSQTPVGGPNAGDGETGTNTKTAVKPTGTVHHVRMVSDERGFRFEPALTTVKPGDAVIWENSSGGPHNVKFMAVADGSAANQLSANMPGQKMEPLAGPLLIEPKATYTVSFGGMPKGHYTYQCTPHAAMNMKGEIVVK